MTRAQPTRPPKAQGRPVSGAKPWDFRHPEGLDRAGLAALRALGESFSRGAGARIGATLRCRTQLRLESIDQSNWGEIESEISMPAVLASFDLRGAGSALVQLPVDLAMVAIDLYLAGSGVGPFPSRAPTDMERQILGGLLDVVSSEVASAASTVIAPVEAGPATQLVVQASQTMSRDEQCAILRFSLRMPQIGEQCFRLDLCLPTTTLRPLLDQLSTSPDRTEAPALPEVERLAKGVPLTLSLRFPPVAVPISVAESLSVGQVLALGHPLGEPLPLYVGDRPLFEANPVAHAKRAACQIVASIDTEEQP